MLPKKTKKLLCCSLMSLRDQVEVASWVYNLGIGQWGAILPSALQTPSVRMFPLGRPRDPWNVHLVDIRLPLDPPGASSVHNSVTETAELPPSTVRQAAARVQAAVAFLGVSLKHTQPVLRGQTSSTSSETTATDSQQAKMCIKNDCSQHRPVLLKSPNMPLLTKSNPFQNVE